jgi:hypothetical protein
MRIQVFPNPFNENLTIVTSNADMSYQLVVKDMTGRTVLERKITGQSNTIDLTNVTDGTYYLELQLNQHNIRIPVVKN